MLAAVRLLAVRETLRAIAEAEAPVRVVEAEPLERVSVPERLVPARIVAVKRAAPLPAIVDLHRVSPFVEDAPPPPLRWLGRRVNEN
jgi:hypothetical protein